jgi:hypothetical protein
MFRMVGGRGAAVAVGAVLVLVASKAAATEPERTRFGVSAGAGVSLYLFEDVGPWLELGAVARVPLGPSWDLGAGIALAYTRNEHPKSLDYDGDGMDDANSDEHQAFGLLPRALFGLRLGPIWSLEAGGFFGLAHTTLNSVQCGSSSATDLGVGASFGPALRLGQHEQWAVALHAEAYWVPFEKCTNSGPDPFVYAPFVHREDDAQIGTVLRAHYFF